MTKYAISEILDENCDTKQEYINFMKQMPSPEERSRMTDDEILDWFISRRGGNKEILRKNIGVGCFEMWLSNWKLVQSKFELDAQVFRDLEKYITTVDNPYYITKESMLQWFKDHNWLGYENEENLMKNLYEAFSKDFISSFRENPTYNRWEQYVMMWTGYGMELNDWISIKKPSRKTGLLNWYVIDGRDDRGYFEF